MHKHAADDQRQGDGDPRRYETQPCSFGALALGIEYVWPQEHEGE